jgi:hypothetical protein
VNKARLSGTDWHFRSDQPRAFGCGSCFLLSVCGGLRVKGAAFDCQRFCCHQPNCQTVCFNAPANYAKRFREIGGFGLDNIPRCARVDFRRLRGYAPLFHHAYSRKKVFSGELVAVSLYELLTREGAPKYFSKDDIVRNFKIRPEAQLVVSGVHKDHLLERVWSSPHRAAIALMLKSIGITVLTAPNFSVYNNVPRPENLYNIKRIALLSYEFLAAGVPTAMHINACTDADYDRYVEFLAARPEFEAISFDFITGPGYPSRMWWHTRKLIELRNRLQRQIQLVLRGGTRAITALAGVYSDIVVIDSDPLLKALHRQRMVFGNEGAIKSIRNPLPKGVPVDELFAQNVEAAKSEINYLFKNPRVVNSLRRRLPSASNVHDKSRKLDLLANSRSSKTRTDSLNTQSVISTPETESAAQIEKTAKEIAKTTAMPGGSSKPRGTVR